MRRPRLQKHTHLEAETAGAEKLLRMIKVSPGFIVKEPTTSVAQEIDRKNEKGNPC
jgi:hypothetical protein